MLVYSFKPLRLRAAGPGAYKVDRDHPEHPDHDRPVGMLRWALGSDAALAIERGRESNVEDIPRDTQWQSYIQVISSYSI